MKRIPELDGLRGLAILLVLVYHYVSGAMWAGSNHWAYWLIDVLSILWSGVDLFFVLSGFLIGGILVDARESPNYFKTFYARRAFRILPIYSVILVTLFASVGMMGKPLIPWYSFVSFTQNFWYATGISYAPIAFAVTWSLAVEEQFYLVLPTIVRFTTSRALPYVLGGGIIAAPVLRIFLFLLSGGNASFFLMPCRADALLLGVMIALAIRNQNVWARVQAQRRKIAFAATTLLVVGLPVFVLSKQTEPRSALVATVGLTWLACFYTCLLLLALLYKETWYGGILRVGWLRGLGTISYSLYLFHWWVLTAAFWIVFHKIPWAQTTEQRVFVLVPLVVSVALATASWRFFEKPLLAIGHKYRYEMASRTLPPPAELAGRPS